jgi:hypothetical protein
MSRRNTFRDLFWQIAEDEVLLAGDLAVDNVYLDTELLTSNGVMMGDPGTKGLLTLMNLAAWMEALEELQDADDITLFQLEQESLPIKDPDIFWTSFEDVYIGDYSQPRRTNMDRAFAERHTAKKTIVFNCAGDDHAAMGRFRFLEKITENHIKNGMVPHPEKNFLSMYGISYCERLLLRTRGTHMIDPSNNYDEHALVDCLKLRLFSPVDKSQGLSNENNPAIGKANALQRFRDWLPPGWRGLGNILVPLRFYQRMYKHMPRDSNGDVSLFITLPLPLGGMGLGGFWRPFVEGDLPKDHFAMLQAALEGYANSQAFRAMESLLKDRYARGIRFDEGEADLLLGEIRQLYGTRTAHQAAMTFETFDGHVTKTKTYPQIAAALVREGFVSERMVREKLRRELQQKRLFTESVDKGWNTATWQQRTYVFCRTLRTLIDEVEREYTRFRSEYDLEFINSSLRDRDIGKLNKLSWREDVFFQLDAVVKGPDGSVTQPLRLLWERAATLELPTLSQRGWLPTGETKQQSLSAGQI